MPDSAHRRTQTETAILAAAREILAESGVEGLTIEGVAARSGVAKTTIYRRYRSKQDLALAVVLAMTEEVVAAELGGDTRAQLVGLLDTAVSLLRDTSMGTVMRGLTSHIATDPALSAAYGERILSLRVRRITEIVQSGVQHGELRADTDPAWLHEMLFGPVYYRLLLSARPLDAALAAGIVDAVLPALRP